MSQPWPAPNPSPLPPLPRETFTVPLKQCCGLLEGDDCDCAEVFAEWVAAMRSPVLFSCARDGRVEVTR